MPHSELSESLGKKVGFTKMAKIPKSAKEMLKLTEAIGKRETEPIAVGRGRPKQRHMEMVKGRQEGTCACGANLLFVCNCT
jgi:hypothetical protein